MFAPLWKSLRRGVRQLLSRRLFIIMMIIVPLGSTLFFISLMDKGLPLPVPATVVDMDQSTLSRKIIRQLAAGQAVEIVEQNLSYHEALDKLKRGESFGFFYIPRDFQQKSLSGQQPTLSFFTNMSIYIPGTMSFKGFKTVAVTTQAGLVRSTLVSAGLSEAQATTMIQPVDIRQNAIGNPWLNYTIYLTPSFISALLVLVIMLVTAYSVCGEIKWGTSVEWLETARGSMLTAVIGKLAPQTLIFTIVGIAIEAIMFKFNHFPVNNHMSHMILAMILLVVATQSWALIICEIVPNQRLSVTICSLVGILTFSVAGFSFPVDQMYGGVGIFAYILPERYFFLIYVDQALNGIPIYFSRWYYIALLIFPILSLAGLRRLRGRCVKPIYVP